eukprot:COSAG01_NODE_30345_length_617_cov_3.886100_1_plen_62_part_00
MGESARGADLVEGGGETGGAVGEDLLALEHLRQLLAQEGDHEREACPGVSILTFVSGTGVT